jgi:hypothetical protein
VFDLNRDVIDLVFGNLSGDVVYDAINWFFTQVCQSVADSVRDSIYQPQADVNDILKQVGDEMDRLMDGGKPRLNWLK